jgi:hypothetical protein
MGRKIAEADPGTPAELTDKLPADRSGAPIHLEVGDILARAYPIGSVYLSVVSTDPATLLGFGTWAQIAQGQALFGQKASDSDFNTAEETGGAKTSDALLAHTHTVTDPGHTHTQDAHTHVQNSHNHTQDAHSHTIPVGATDDTSAPFDRADAGTNAAGANATNTTGTATAVNQAATAVNQNATAVNQANTTGVTVDSAGSGASFSILPPYFIVFAWKRVA